MKYTSKLLRKFMKLKKIIFIHIDEIWSIDLADFSDYKTSNKKGYRYIFVIIDKLSEFLWAIPKKNKTITDEF